MCAIATIITCFSLSGFYIDGAALHSNIGEGRFVSMQAQPDGHLPWYTDSTGYHEFRDAGENPYVRIAIGYDVQWSPNWSTRLDYSHESSIATGLDHGSEKVTLGVTWRPFAH